MTEQLSAEERAKKLIEWYEFPEYIGKLKDLITAAIREADQEGFDRGLKEADGLTDRWHSEGHEDGFREGRQAGLEEAAELTEENSIYKDNVIAQRIRSLAQDPAKPEIVHDEKCDDGGGKP